MRLRMKSPSWMTCAGLLTLAAWTSVDLHANVPKKSGLQRVLLLYDTNSPGWASSRVNLVRVLDSLAVTHGFELITPEDSDFSMVSALSLASLRNTQAVIFAYSSGPWIHASDSIQAEFETWVRNGGGFIAIHEAAMFIPGEDFLSNALGLQFKGFAGGSASNRIKASLVHDTEGMRTGSETLGILRGLAPPNEFQDVYISLLESPRGKPDVTILSTVDEASISNPEEPSEDHPVFWTKREGSGRAMTMALGVSGSEGSPILYDSYTQAESYLTKILYRSLLYLAGDFTGCTDSADVNYNPEATHSDWMACQSLGVRVGKSHLDASDPRLSVLQRAGVIRIDFKGAEAHRAVLMDLRGKIIESRKGAGAENIELSPGSATGAYILLTSQGKKTSIRRIVIPQ